jgi:hypothetical protein
VSSIKNVAEPDNTNPMVASDAINNQNHDEQVSAERLIGKTGLDFSEDINAIITDYSI